MSFSIEHQNLQIWENAAFDDVGNTAGAKPWLPLQPISVNLSRIPNLSKKDKLSVKPRMQGGGSVADECNIDAEIEDTEKEIRRLSMRLESLRMEKIERDLRVSTAQRGRIVPAKFMERKACPASKKEESQAIAGMRRRGFSLGPLEIHGSAGKSSIRKLDSVKEEILSTSPPFVNAKTDTKCCKKKTADFSTDSSSVGYRRRGLSLGPSEIASISRSRFPSRLQEVKDRGKPEKRQSSSVSPKAQKPSVNELRKGISTVGCKKSLENREDAMLGNFKPKVLFQKGQNPTVTCKKPLKNTSARVRAVASRFSLAAAPTDEPERKRRKWSLPEPFKVKNGGTEGELNGSVIHLSGETQVDPLLTVGSPPSIMKIAAMLPRIRTLHGASESPRNSGCAKRVAQLVGKKHHFSMQHDEVSVVSPTHPIHRTLNPS